MLDKEFWDSRYKEGSMGWDIGYPSPPLTNYIDQLERKDLKILIPGAGNAYEAEYLWESGFQNTWILDISPTALDRFEERVPDFPVSQMIEGNFFDLEGQFDIILEQTFFCALDPDLRDEYARQVHELLTPGGRLAGVLFNIPLNDDRPPFGGNVLEYLGVFSKVFEELTIKPCRNSIPERAGNEVFIRTKKHN